jgi:V/A-type H+-transporting ATPase subunit I
MAIIPLKKVFVYCMKADVEPVMHALQERGVLHISSAAPQADEMHQIIEDAHGEEILDRIGFALDVAQRYDNTKTPFLSSKPDITTEEYRSLKDKAGMVDQAYTAAKDLEDALSSIRSELQKKTNQIASLKPFTALNMPLSYLRGTQSADVHLGFLPEDAAGQVRLELEGMDGLVYTEFFERWGQALPVLIVVHKDKSRQVRELIKSAGYSDARLEDLKDTPAEITQRLEGEIKALMAQREQAAANAEGVSKYKDDLLALEDYYRGEVLREKALQKAIASSSVAVIEGYVKHYEQDKLEQAVSSVAREYFIEARDPDEDDEDLPTATENNAVVTPFEAVTDMYSVPGPRTFDANALMMPFYFVFFGMMLSDAAYGIILTVGSIIFLKMKKPEGTFKKILMVLAICGISTVIWGTGFGSFMGFDVHPWLFNPLKNPLNMLILCLSLGVIHLIAGLIMGAYINVKRKRVAAAVFDQGFWILILAAIPFIALGKQTAGMFMLAAGAVGIIATAGRHNKGIIKKVTGGLSGLYGITGYLSDILSYARLFGMALATSVIAMVFNTIAGMMAGGLVGWAAAVVIFLIGHVFNIGINSLGAFVHSARLQYIEFFSKFYEGGGVPFDPLRVKLKNYRMVK